MIIVAHRSFSFDAEYPVLRLGRRQLRKHIHQEPPNIDSRSKRHLRVAVSSNTHTSTLNIQSDIRFPHPIRPIARIKQCRRQSHLFTDLLVDLDLCDVEAIVHCVGGHAEFCWDEEVDPGEFGGAGEGDLEVEDVV